LLMLLAVVLMAVLVVLSSGRAAEATTTFTVNTIDDDGDITITNSTCDSDPAAGEQCTLRAAIEEANDTDDLDKGPNNLQNFPRLNSATRSLATGVTTISGRLNSTPTQDFVIQCFLVNGAPTSAHGEGSRLLDTEVISTGANGNSQFTCDSSLGLLGLVPLQTVSATATNILTTGDTSEFSKNKAITTGP
jgi:hypothetical protein